MMTNLRIDTHVAVAVYGCMRDPSDAPRKYAWEAHVVLVGTADRCAAGEHSCRCFRYHRVGFRGDGDSGYGRDIALEVGNGEHQQLK